MMEDGIRQWMASQFGDDAETIALVWNEYLADTAKRLAAARAALTAGDFTELDRVAHTLKGNALNVGDRRMMEAALALREASQTANGSLAEGLLARMTLLDAENRA